MMLPSCAISFFYFDTLNGLDPNRCPIFPFPLRIYGVISVKIRTQASIPYSSAEHESGISISVYIMFYPGQVV